MLHRVITTSAGRLLVVRALGPESSVLFLLLWGRVSDRNSEPEELPACESLQ